MKLEKFPKLPNPFQNPQLLNCQNHASTQLGLMKGDQSYQQLSLVNLEGQLNVAISALSLNWRENVRGMTKGDEDVNGDCGGVRRRPCWRLWRPVGWREIKRYERWGDERREDRGRDCRDGGEKEKNKEGDRTSSHRRIYGCVQLSLLSEVYSGRWLALIG